MTWGLTPDGFVAKTLEEIEAGMVERQRANIDPGIDTSEFGLVGQLNGIMASDLAELWELAEAVYGASDPHKATGVSQDALYSLTSSEREPPTASRVLATVVLEAGANIPAGEAIASVAGNRAARFANAVPLVNTWDITRPVDGQLFVALATGPVAANAGTLTQRDTLPTGWVSITNPADAELGRDLESDAAYRIRREIELAAQGGGTVAGIRADLLQLETVTAARVLDNPTDDVSPEGLPPHSFEAVVQSVLGATDEDAIAQSIWGNKPAGIEPHGSIGGTATDPDGVPHEVRFSRPVVRPIDLYVEVMVDGDVYLGDDALRDALANATGTLGSPAYLEVGTDVYAAPFVLVAMAQPGVINAYASLASGTYLGTIAIGPRELAEVDTTRIHVLAIEAAP